VQAVGGSVCIVPLAPVTQLLIGVIIPVICVLELFLIATVHGLAWLFAARFTCPSSVYLLRFLLPTERTFKKSPYLRTLCSLFAFSCEYAATD
jgi:hypothetical protein